MIIGIDEAGRGALAGPVVAGAVCFTKKLVSKNCPVFKLIKDSKKLTDTQRREVFVWLKENVVYGVGTVSAAVIDETGIKPATEKAMNLALENLLKYSSPRKAPLGRRAVPLGRREGIRLLIDGRDNFKFPLPSEDIIKGDEKILEISAASIMAKVTRDDLMRAFDSQYPKFSFATHKGYGAKSHYDLLDEGVFCAIHRKTYDPLKTWLHQGRLF